MGAEHDKLCPSWTSRLLAVAGYVGLTPLLRLFRVRRGDVYLRHHQTQGLAALPLLVLVLLIWPAYLLAETCLVQNRVGQASHFHTAQNWITLLSLGGLGLWGLTSVLGVGVALAGSTRPLPLLARLARRPRLMGVALLGNCVLMAFVVLVVGVAVHASSLAHEDAAPAPVYYLYDDQDLDFLGTSQSRVHELFCYRMSLVARSRWGSGSVVVAPLTADNFWAAVNHGRLVVVISHGHSGRVSLPDGQYVLPVSIVNHGNDLQVVYLSACDGGQKATEWEQKFAPAEVVTFDRLSGALEHLWWLWFDAPDRLEGIR